MSALDEYPRYEDFDTGDEYFDVHMTSVGCGDAEVFIPKVDGRTIDQDEWLETVKRVDHCYRNIELGFGTIEEYRAWEAFHREHKLGRLFQRGSRDGYVYLLYGEGTGFCKIGRTKNVDQRVRQLEIQVPFKVNLLHWIKTNNCHHLEAFLHWRFRSQRANGEWFNLSEKDIAWLKSYDEL